MEMVGDEEDLELHPVEDEDELERVIDFVRQELENEFDEDDLIGLNCSLAKTREQFISIKPRRMAVSLPI